MIIRCPPLPLPKSAVWLVPPSAHGVGSTKDRQPEVSSCSNHHDNVGVWQSGITLTTSLHREFHLHELGMPWRAHPLRHPDDSGRSGHDRPNASRDRSWPFGLPFGTPIEVQIRTHEMNKLAESGVASHWLYKSSEAQINDLHQKTHQWLQSLLESLAQSGDSVEFLEHLKVDLFPDEVYVFSPKGKIYALPRGATAVDFAYSVHTDIGNRCVAAKVNSELVPLRTELSNGDRVEIVTATLAHPNPAWLSYVVTSKARGEIRHALKTMHLGESAKLGERLLGQALGSLGFKLQDIPDMCWERVLKESSAKTRQEIFADIGLGRRLNMVIARQLAKMNEGDSNRTEASSSGIITLLGNEGMAVQYAKCCRPIPGDPIIGVIKSGQGLIVHTHDCPSLRKGRSGGFCNHTLQPGS